MEGEEEEEEEDEDDAEEGGGEEESGRMRRSMLELRTARTASEPGVSAAMSTTASAKLRRMALTIDLRGGHPWATLSQSFFMALMASGWYWGFDLSLWANDLRRARKSVPETRWPSEVKTFVRMGWVWVWNVWITSGRDTGSAPD